MGFIYLDGKNWIDVTREERLFCSYLYWDIKKSVKDFVSWLSTISGLALRFDDTWEVGYEVCFYRDLQKFRRKPLDLTRYSRKRTFDICLFSESTIVIIEAKVQQMFKENEIQEFQRDRVNIPAIIGRNVNVLVVALASSQYFENYGKYGRRDILSKPNFDALISWKQVCEFFRNELYLEADRKYRN